MNPDLHRVSMAQTDLILAKDACLAHHSRRLKDCY